MSMMSVEEFRAMVARANKPTSRSTRKPRQLEHDVQVACVDWFARTYPEYEPFFWATPNGMRCVQKVARRMKAEGMKAGVPDLQLAYPAKGYHGLFLETKKAEKGQKGQLIHRGKASEAQVKRMAELERVGYLCKIFYTLEQFQEIVNGYLRTE